jgi:hypothetical protein
MSRISLTLVAAVVVVAALFAPPRAVRAQGATRIEYVRVTSYVVRTPVVPNAVQERDGYRACVAGITDWACRDFPPTQSSMDALRTALATLGNEGWDLVSAVQQDPNMGTHGMTYVFKRQAR